MTDPAIRLARHREGDPANTRARIDDHGLGLSIELPSPAALAAHARETLGAGLVATSSGIARRDEPMTALPTSQLVEELREWIGRLPELPAARRPYQDLRRFGATPRPVVDALLASAIRELRRILPKYTPPRKPRESAAPITPAEAARRRRERLREHQQTAAREWLEAWRESAVPGATLASSLYADACAAIEEYIAADVDLDDGRPYVLPGRDNFYAVADDALGARVRRNGNRVYRVAA